MNSYQPAVEFVVMPVPSTGGAGEFRQSMRPHPLVYQELPHEPHFGLYNGRLRSLSYARGDSRALYWRLRRQVMMAHTGERPTEICGPQAVEMLNRVFTRDVAKVRVGRCSYQIACYPDGGFMMDGVLVRLAEDRFWYVQSDGDFYSWLRAQAQDFDVLVFDPDIWVSQVQGPRSLDVLAAASYDGLPERFNYFDAATIRIAGYPVVITRTGFTNELGWEFYLEPHVDIPLIGERIMEAGRPFDMQTTPAEVTNARRLEGGLMFAGTDFDEHVTPFDAGFSKMVEFDGDDFIGRAALENADRRQRIWGLTCADGEPQRGARVVVDGNEVGRITSSAWSPTLQCGIAIVRMNASLWSPGDQVTTPCTDGAMRLGELCELPFYDAAGDIRTGRSTEIPEIIPG